MFEWLRGKNEAQLAEVADTVVESNYADRWKTQLAPQAEDLVKQYREIQYACINLNSRAVASAQLQLFVITRRGEIQPRCPTRAIAPQTMEWLLDQKDVAPILANAEDVQEVTDHPLLTLLHTPNPFQNSFTLMELTALYLETVGRAYWLMDKQPILDIPIRLWVLPSQHINPKAAKGQLIDHYEWLGQSTTIPVDRVIPFLVPDLTDPYRSGKSPTAAGWETLTLLERDRGFQAATMDNRARPDLIISPKDAMAWPAVKRLRAILRRMFTQRGSGGTAFFPEAIEVTPLNFKPKDTEARERAEQAKTTLANIYDVPITLIDKMAESRAGADASLFQHARLAVVPRLMRIVHSLNRHLVPLYDPRLFLWFKNPVPRDQIVDTLTRRRNLDAGVTTMNEERRDMGRAPVAWGDKPWMKSTLVQPSDDPENNERQGAQEAGPQGPNAVIGSDRDRSPDGGRETANLGLKALIFGHERFLPSGQKIAEVIRSILAEQRLSLLRQVEEVPEQKAIGDPSDPVDLSQWNEEMAERVMPTMLVTFKKGLEEAVDRLGLESEAVFRVTEPELERAVQRLALAFSRSTNLSTGLRVNRALADVRTALREGLIELGSRPAEISRKIGEIFNGLARFKADEIALTEASRAVHAAQRMAGDKSGVVVGYKWLLSADACPICQEIVRNHPNGIMKEADFGASEIAGPNTPAAYTRISHPPAHPNCRCSLTEILASDEQIRQDAEAVDRNEPSSVVPEGDMAR